MVNYSCDKCGKKFTQKGHYTRHMNKKNPCIHMSKINEMVDAAVEKRLKETNITTCLENTFTSPITSKLTSVREQGLDKFYTIPSYSKKCINKVNELYDNDSWGLIVEPSAGNGSFYNQIESSNKIGIDIAPEIDGLVKQDFFTYQPPENTKRILVIGNPPFGRVSSLAIQFFNHAAHWADVIAFIIPKTFRRISVQNRLNDSFHLMYDEDVPDKPCSFTPNMSVKCCFQIWKKIEKSRNKYMGIREIYGKLIKMYGFIYKTYWNGWEMVGVYPTYVLRSGAFLAGAFFFLKSRSLFIKSVFLYVFIIKPPFL